MPPSSEQPRREKDLLWIFDAALILKAFDGAVEILGAAIIFFYPSLIVRVAEFATAGELSQDPADIIANTIRNAAHAFSVSGHLLVSIYLALHGLIKVLLVVGIFSGKKVAYPLFIIALSFFAAYEAYRGTLRGEPLLQLFAIFDCMLLILTAYEYRRRYPLAAPAAIPRPDSD